MKIAFSGLSRTRLVALTIGAFCVSLAFAQTPPLVKPAEDSVVESDQNLETVPADTSRAILQKFKESNPEYKEHQLDLVSEAYTEDATNPGLKLNKMWVGKNGTLLEITGLPRTGQANSATMAPSTIRLLNLKSQKTTNLVAFDGVAQVLDKRGGSALVLKPGDTMYLLLGPIDDYQPQSLEYLGWDNKRSKYFDRIDPRFKERYQDAYRAASGKNATPESMKDFLVEFAKNDPDKKAPEVFLALIERMRAQNSFEGYYQAYLLMQDPADAKAAYRLVRNDEHRAKMEFLAVATLADKSRLLNLSATLSPSSTQSGEGSCIWFCKYNFSATRQVKGQVTVSAKRSGSPIKLKMGTYKVNFDVEARLPRWKIEKAWYGPSDKQADEVFNGTLSVTLSPPNYTATINYGFANWDVAFFQRGSVGGYTAIWATGDGQIKIKFKSMELVK